MMGRDPATPYDLAVIGAGVVGTAIARELARYRLEVVLIEGGSDVGVGTSKANTAILHTGFDANPGSLESKLVRRGSELLHKLGPDLGIPIEHTGAVLVAWNETELAELDPIQEKARANGYEVTVRLTAEDVYRLEPYLGPRAMAGIAVPDESIVCPFTASLAFATQAVANGVTLLLDSRVIGVTAGLTGHTIELSGGRRLEARWIVNAAGLNSDIIDGYLGHHRFTVTPRRGELIVFDKLARRLIDHVLLPIPTKIGKGVLVAPTAYGNVMLGPTAEDLDDKLATGSSAAGISGLWAKGQRIMPRLLDEEVTSVYAGLRAATEHSDYQLFLEADERYLCVGGIRSTGLTASLGIAEHVAGLLKGAGVRLDEKPDFVPVKMPNIGEARPRPYQSVEAIARDRDYGRIVCHCERVTKGEIRDAMRTTIPARSVDALRRRTRAQSGRCQGFFCAAEVDEMLAAGTGQSIESILVLVPPGAGAAPGVAKDTKPAMAGALR
ncbi:MAG: NAD(P)/FAD-dependent oxidoreductase [Candidatus Limnocylindrales bacterium]